MTRRAARPPASGNGEPVRRPRTLKLPEERHSHGLRRLAAIESTQGSFEGAIDAIARGTAVPVGKRQAEQFAAKAAGDSTPSTQADGAERAGDEDVPVISADGKGIVMRPDSLPRHRQIRGGGRDRRRSASSR